jgi:broad specificity phosphatase PhoE
VNHLFLLRHGATTTPGRFCGSTDTTLSEGGWQQMSRAVENQAWDRIVSSQARRCSEFGIWLARSLSVPHATDVRLREMHFGDWEGRSAAELMQSAPDEIRSFWQDPAGYPPPGAEALDAVRQRVLAAWQELGAHDAAQRCLIITHGGPMRILRSIFDPRAATNLLDIEVPHAALWDSGLWPDLA